MCSKFGLWRRRAIWHVREGLNLLPMIVGIFLHYSIPSCIKVPPDYPETQVKIEDAESNFPRVFKVWFVEKARDLARQCVEPPLKPKPKDPPFKKSPSLLRYVVVSRVDYPIV